MNIVFISCFVQETLKSCNNACWALGELAIKLQPENLIQGNLAGEDTLYPSLTDASRSPP